MTNRDLLILAGEVSERLELTDEEAKLEDVVATCLSVAGVQRIATRSSHSS